MWVPKKMIGLLMFHSNLHIIIFATCVNIMKVSCVPDLLGILLYHRGYRGGLRQQGRHVKSKLQKTASFIVVESFDVPPQHTHTHTYILTSALILPKDSRR